MTVESSFNYPSDLNASLPTAGDARSEGDDHIRGIKNVLKTTLPNVTAPITPTAAQLNTVATRGPILISSASPSGASTVAVSSGIDSTYDVYEWHLVNFVPSAAATLLLRLGSASASGGYDWIRTSSTGTTATVANGGGSATEFTLTASNADTTAAGGGWTGWIRVYEPASTTTHKKVEWHLTYTTSTTNGNMVSVRGHGTYETTSAMTSFHLVPSAGTMTGGHKLYGWVKS